MILTVAAFQHLEARCVPRLTDGRPLVPMATIRAVAETESGLDPYAIKDDRTGRGYAPPSASAAIALARRLMARGHVVDLGLMQISSPNLPKLGMSVRGAFSACLNIRAGVAWLYADYTGGGPHGALVALSRYNTGGMGGFRNGYVASVIAHAHAPMPAIQAQRLPSHQPQWLVFAGARQARSWQVFPAEGAKN